MTPYELLYTTATPFLPALYGRVRRDLGRLLAETGGERPRLLDVGGRKSPYTIGLPADITLLDIPQESDVQRELHLGVTHTILHDLQRRRSNIAGFVLQDMTRCTLPSDSFGGAICVEVIEHVVEDEAFVRQIARVLRPGGWLYVTTPNGDYMPSPRHNPDHVRHFQRDELRELLARHFADVQVAWGIRTGKNRTRGLRTLSPRHPLSTAQAMVSNVLSRLESRGLDGQPRRTAHLFAIARKRA
jgi:SAM-dependent methyltransferase